MLAIPPQRSSDFVGDMWNKIVRFLSANPQAGEPLVRLAEIKFRNGFASSSASF
jgi:hypothetical protein